MICTEKLTHIIQERINMNEGKPIKLSTNEPPISHLFFADDVFLFAEASVEQADKA